VITHLATRVCHLVIPRGTYWLQRGPTSPENDGTLVNRWLVLDVTMPIVLRPLRFAITSSFDKENLRTMAAIREFAERHPREGGAPGPTPEIAVS
jgi:hypothetical protein